MWNDSYVAGWPPEAWAVSGNRCATHSQQLYSSHNALVGVAWARRGQKIMLWVNCFAACDRDSGARDFPAGQTSRPSVNLFGGICGSNSAFFLFSFFVAASGKRSEMTICRVHVIGCDLPKANLKTKAQWYPTLTFHSHIIKLDALGDSLTLGEHGQTDEMRS